MKKIFDFYHKKKALSWLIIVITSIIEPTLLILWISLITYALVKKKDLFISKIDKKYNNKEWDKKMKNLDKNWDVKLKKIEKDWKKNPKKALLLMAGVFVGIIFIYEFIIYATAKNYNKLSYIEYDCSTKKTTLFRTLDKDKMKMYNSVETDQFPGKVTRTTQQIIDWKGNKISVELLPSARNAFYPHEPYFKNDKFYQQGLKAFGGDWFSTDCKIIDQR